MNRVCSCQQGRKAEKARQITRRCREAGVRPPAWVRHLVKE